MYGAWAFAGKRHEGKCERDESVFNSVICKGYYIGVCMLSIYMTVYNKVFLCMCVCEKETDR